MPVHDWSRALNRGLLPAEYYALPEQIAGGLGPDVLTMKELLDTPGQDPPAGS
jgi:hypothetical protein